MRWYHWIIAPILVIVAVAAYLAGRRNTDLASSIATEMDALEARAVAKRVMAERDAEAAAQEIEERYSDKMAKLNDESRKTAADLRADPVALADWLARIGR